MYVTPSISHVSRVLISAFQYTYVDQFLVSVPNYISREQNDLPHPPLTVVGNEHAWRSADGSGNNVTDPNLGKAGEPYARSVSQSKPLAHHQMPDPGLIFDTLLRRDKVRAHILSSVE